MKDETSKDETLQSLCYETENVSHPSDHQKTQRTLFLHFSSFKTLILFEQHEYSCQSALKQEQIYSFKE